MSGTFLRTRDTTRNDNKKSNWVRQKIKNDNSKYTVGHIRIRTIEKIKQNDVIRIDRGMRVAISYNFIK